MQTATKETIVMAVSFKGHMLWSRFSVLSLAVSFLKVKTLMNRKENAPLSVLLLRDPDC